MNNTLIKKITEQSTGVYVIEIDRERAFSIKGKTYLDKVNNAIDNFESMYMVEQDGKQVKVALPKKKLRITKK